MKDNKEPSYNALSDTTQEANYKDDPLTGTTRKRNIEEPPMMGKGTISSDSRFGADPDEGEKIPRNQRRNNENIKYNDSAEAMPGG